MNSAAQIAKLEALLGRIERNRRPAPGPIAFGPIAASAEPARSPEPAPSPAAPAPVEKPAASFAEETTGERLPPPKPTPMEMALEGVGLEPDEMDVEITVDEGPEISIDEGEFEGDVAAAPSAPVETRAPAPSIPEPIDVTPAQPSAPIAHVVSRRAPIAPTTFGELLERTLALRPR